MAKLWQKKVSDVLNKDIDVFLNSKDTAYDQVLVPYDVYGSIAHAKMLVKIGLLDKESLSKVLLAFEQILELHEKGKFVVSFEDEDVHTKVENFLVDKLGDTGKKIHTGRSRNDQVLLDLRLFSKDEILEVVEFTSKVVSKLLLLSEKHKLVPMPGYTHMQKAMPSSVGMWFSSYAESLLDGIECLFSSYKLVNKSPLGSAAGYGVPLPLDREHVAKQLGFAGVQINSLYCQNGRGKMESFVVSSLLQIMFDVSRFASDVLLFTTSEYGFFSVNDTITTGSSIMPQKKNVDVAEVLRAKVYVVKGFFDQIVGISANLPSGYNRDIQESKAPYMEAFWETKKSLEVFKILLDNTSPNVNRLKSSLSSEIFATHYALNLVENGKSFRDAYVETGNNIDKVQSLTFEEVYKKSSHLGGLSNLQINLLKSRNKEYIKKQTSEKKIISGKIQSLLKV